ncbi:MAG: hypothetical protein KC492_38415, partial [Myxococcales bacterium]|nr:hypothetical protein [Myxococcales bacterium]
SVTQMTKDEFNLLLLDHWFPTENRGDPPADAAALLGLKRGDDLGEGWKVRGIRVADNAIRVEVVRPNALFVTQVQLGVQVGTMAQSERYSLTATNERPGPYFFQDIDLSKPVEAIAKHVREHEKQVPVPQGLSPIPPTPILPGTVIPAEPSAPAASDAAPPAPSAP